MPISHLGLTIKGGVHKEEISGHTCLTNRFKVLKGLKTLDFILTSAYIKDKDKKEIQEEMKEKLIKDYERPKELKKPKAKVKRTASAEIVAGKKIKKIKKVNTSVSIDKSEPLFVDTEFTLLGQIPDQNRCFPQIQSSRSEVPETRA